MPKKLRNRIIFYTLLLISMIGVVWWAIVWQERPIYTGSFANQVEQKHERDRAIQGQSSEKTSKEPRPIGFREADIKKYRGKRYAAY